MDEIKSRRDLEKTRAELLGSSATVTSSTYCEHVSYLLELLETANELAKEVESLRHTLDVVHGDYDVM